MLLRGLATLPGGVIIATPERPFCGFLRRIEARGRSVMGHSRAQWLLGAVAGVFLVGVGAGVRLATMPYALHVRVLDTHGGVSNAWVSLNDGEVLSSNEQGVVTFKGSRFKFDSGTLTVSDASADSKRLSQTQQVSVSWNPFQSESTIDVNLPIVDSLANREEPSNLSSTMDLPLDEARNQEQAVDRFDLRKINEEQLTDPNPETSSNLYLPLYSLDLSLQKSGVLSCLLSGFSGDVCGYIAANTKASFSLEQPPSMTQLPASSKILLETSLVEAQSPESLSSQSEITVEPDGKASKSPMPFARPVRVEIYLDGKPLEGALIYMSRIKDNRVRELGVTSADGLLLVKITPQFWGETVTIFHPCCSPKTISAKLTQQKGEERLRVEMHSGTGMGVVIQQEAYGYLRKYNAFDLIGTSGKLSVSGHEGFALYNSTKTPELIPHKVLIRNAKPAEIFIRPADVQQAQIKPLNFLVAPDEIYLPSLAIIEKQDGRAFQGVLKDSKLRRWRRDFMARLMQQTSLRTVVSVESEARIAAAGESGTDIIANGWNQSLLAGEWDLLLAIDYDEGRQSLSLLGKSSDGRTYFDQQIRFDKNSSVAPETISRQFFQSFLEAVPFESHVVRQQGQIVELSFSGQSLFGIKENTPLALYQKMGTKDEEKSWDLAALATVLAGESSKGVQARITHWNHKARKTEVLPDVVRAVKISEEFYSRESIKRSMSLGKGKGKSEGAPL